MTVVIKDTSGNTLYTSTATSWKVAVLEAVRANINFMYVDLNGQNIRGLVLNSAIMTYADLHNADLRRCDFHQARLDHANLAGANARDSNFHMANLTHANLSSTDFSYADLSYTDLRLSTKPGIIYDHAETHGMAVGSLP